MFLYPMCTCMCLFLFLFLCFFSSYSRLKLHAERPVSPRTTHLEKIQTYQYHCCKQEHLYIVSVFLSHSISLSAVNQWSVRTSFKLSHCINTGSIDFFKQLMEAFRAGKLIKIIYRSSSFKDSPLVYVELYHA